MWMGWVVLVLCAGVGLYVGINICIKKYKYK